MKISKWFKINVERNLAQQKIGLTWILIGTALIVTGSIFGLEVVGFALGLPLVLLGALIAQKLIP